MWILGGGWNRSPGAVSNSGLRGAVKGTVITPEAAVCHPQWVTPDTLDYFLAGRGIAALTECSI